MFTCPGKGPFWLGVDADPMFASSRRNGTIYTAFDLHAATKGSSGRSKKLIEAAKIQRQEKHRQNEANRPLEHRI